MASWESVLNDRITFDVAREVESAGKQMFCLTDMPERDNDHARRACLSSRNTLREQ